MRTLASIVAAVLAAAPSCARRGGTEEGPAAVDDVRVPVRAGRVSAALPARARAWLDLYDQAGFPGVEGLRRLRFEAGRARQGDGEVTILWRDGWVLPGGRGLLLDSLWTHAATEVETDDGVVLEPVPAPVPGFMRRDPGASTTGTSASRSSVREVIFVQELRRELDAAERLAAADAEDVDFEMLGRQGPRAVYWLARARWAEMLGDDDLARRALTQVERFVAIDCRKDPCALEAALRDDLQVKLLWQAVDGLARWRPRAEVRALLERARAIAPGGAHVDEVQALLERTERTLASDPTEAPAWPDEATPEPARIARLIDLLREQSGRQWGAPGWCDPLDVPDPIQNPAAELVRIGRPAIPALIERLGDDTLTRSVGYHRDFYFSHRVLSVGEVALAIIEQIAGRSFSAAGASSAAALQAEVRAWWSSARERSERDQLVLDLRAAPEPERPALALRLLARFGVEPWDELVAVFRATRSPRVRARLCEAMNQGANAEDSGRRNVTIINPVGGEPEAEEARILAFLREALADRDAAVRLAAAEALQARGRAEGVAVVIRDLNALDRLDPGGDVGLSPYLGMLLADGSPPAIAAVAKAVRRWGHPALEVLGGVFPICEARACGLSPAARRPLLEAIAGFLDDHDVGPGASAGGPERVRDAAARAYVVIDGIEAPGLDRERTSIERDRAILALANAERQRQGQPPLRWPHAEPLGPERPGRDALRRTHLIHAELEESAARQWLAALPVGAVSLPRAAASLVAFAERHRGVTWILRVHRFPGGQGVVVTLEGAGRHSGDHVASTYTCVGTRACAIVGSTQSASGAASELFGEFLHTYAGPAWAAEPRRVEEYVLAVAFPGPR